MRIPFDHFLVCFSNHQPRICEILKIAKFRCFATIFGAFQTFSPNLPLLTESYSKVAQSCHFLKIAPNDSIFLTILIHTLAHFCSRDLKCPPGDSRQPILSFLCMDSLSRLFQLFEFRFLSLSFVVVFLKTILPQNLSQNAPESYCHCSNVVFLGFLAHFLPKPSICVQK